ncbi:MAG: bifunctional oligoribonuclease/PAP phosphatase NrnA [Lachnospiraceae bacterium]|nr:bifunctional oligoribonuclease/PAP phosphatase NrnA [Lachnospiraceae bacterium]
MNFKGNSISEIIADAKNIGIAGHVRPDGDCIGSCLGLYRYIKDNYADVKVSVYLEEVPNAFGCLEDAKDIHTSFGVKEPFELFIALDCGDEERLGKARQLFQNAKRTFCVDHHISNIGYADTNYVVGGYSSTSELLYWLMEDGKISKTCASALYVGIAHDTGLFRHSCTTKQTMLAAGNLIDKDIPFSQLLDDTYSKKTNVQNQIMGRCLLESLVLFDGKVIASVLTGDMMDFYGATDSDLEGIIDQLRVTEGVEVALLIHQLKTQEYKVSMRSNGDVDVSKIAALYGGGGHVKAAGCTMGGSYHDIINNITEQIEAQLMNNN